MNHEFQNENIEGLNSVNKKYANKGLTGLANLGNTCYINSCIQLLSNTYELNDFLFDNNYKKKLNKKIDSLLLIEYHDLLNLIWKENCTISPERFIKSIHKVSEIKNKEIFTGYAQNDMPEFLFFVIDCFHTSLSRKVNMVIEGNPINEKDKLAVSCFETIKQMYSNEYSEIWNLFYGLHISQIINLEKNQVISSKPEPYFIINLPIPEDNKSPSLMDCFDLYIKGEILEGDNAYFYEEINKKINVRKNIVFWSFPSILVIDIKRFNYLNRKNQILVSFPLENLDLSKYVVGYDKNKYVYDLYGICNHSGNVLGGHYTSFVKNQNGKWYHYNDTNVTEITNLNLLVSPKAYCFFYRRR